MSMTSLLVLFIVFTTLYFVIIEVFTVLFRLTGLTEEKAKTQVISLLTNSGFTTSESEVILAGRRRRKLAQITMLFGYSFTVIIVSVIVNIFLALTQSELRSILAAVIALTVLTALLFCVMRLRAVKRWFDQRIERLGNRIMFGPDSNTVVLIDNYRDKAMVEIHLHIVPAFLRGVRLADTGLRKTYGIQVLFIKRGGNSLYKIDGDTVLKEDDSVFLFGDYKNIRVIFEHPGTAE